MEEWNFDEIILYKNIHEIHGGGHIWIVWTHFNLEHGSLLIIAGGRPRRPPGRFPHRPASKCCNARKLRHVIDCIIIPRLS